MVAAAASFPLRRRAPSHPPAEVAGPMAVVANVAQRRQLPRRPSLTGDAICCPAIVAKATCFLAAVHARAAKSFCVTPGKHLHSLQWYALRR